jgi:hypothetical protein
MSKARIAFGLVFGAAALLAAMPRPAYAFKPDLEKLSVGQDLQDGDAALFLKSSSHPSVPGTLREVHLGEEMPRRLTVEREHTA